MIITSSFLEVLKPFDCENVFFGDLKFACKLISFSVVLSATWRKLLRYFIAWKEKVTSESNENDFHFEVSLNEVIPLVHLNEAFFFIFYFTATLGDVEFLPFPLRLARMDGKMIQIHYVGSKNNK